MRGAAKGQENLRRLEDYLAGLARANRLLPVRDGKPNLSAIALACGFDRGVLYANEAAKALLERAAQEFGLESAEHQPMAEPGQGADPRDKRIMRLEQHNTALKAENASLRADLVRLRERLRRLEHIEAHMVETGRRVVP